MRFVSTYSETYIRAARILSLTWFFLVFTCITSECKMYTAGSSIMGNGGGTSNLPGDLLIFTNGVWSSVSSSAHTACPCRSTLGIKLLITNGLLEQYSPAGLHCCRMYANISPVSRLTRKNCVPKYGSNRCNVITTAPA